MKLSIKGEVYSVDVPDLVVRYWYPSASYVISDEDGFIVVVQATDEVPASWQRSRFYQIGGKNYKELYCGQYNALAKKMSRNKQYVQLTLF